MKLRKGTNGKRQIMAKKVRTEGPGREKLFWERREEIGQVKAGTGSLGRGEAITGVETSREWTSKRTQQCIWAEAGRGESLAPVQQPHTGTLWAVTHGKRLHSPWVEPLLQITRKLSKLRSYQKYSG